MTLMRRLYKGIAIFVLFCLALGGIFFAVLHYKNRASDLTSKRPRIFVTVTPAIARKGDIGIYQDAIGTVTPVYTSLITSQVTGMVMAVHYREGQLVHQNDPLIDIDPRPFAANLQQAQGTLERDIHLLAQARMDLERFRAAWTRNAIAKQTLEDQEKIVLQDEGTVRADQGAVEFAQVQLAYCHITAPITGRVGLRLIDPGNIVQANGTSPLVVITQEHPITVIFTLAEDAIEQIQSQLRQGRKLRVDAYNRTAQIKIATGTLLTLDNQIDTTTGTVKLRAEFNNTEGKLFPNQFVNTRLLVTTVRGTTLIPTSAIQHNGQNAFVYLVQNGTAQARNIIPGVSEGNVTAVKGLEAGAIIANSSFEKLRPGVEVALAGDSQSAAQRESGAP